MNKLLVSGAISKTNETELSVVLTNGSVIKLKGADNPDSLRGVGLDGVVLDEYAFMKPSVWEEIIRPMLLDRGGWAIFISTPKGYNHFYDLWESVPEMHGWERFHFTSYDNPYLPRQELENIKETSSDIKFSQEYLAEFVKFEGAVWPMFSRDQHIKKKRVYDTSLQHVAAIDFGFAKGHPTAFGVLEFNNQGDAFLADGFMEEGLTIEQIDEKMTQLCQGIAISAVYYDSARPDLAEELKKRGWPMQPALKDVEVGVAKVGEFFNINPLTNRPRLTISEHLVSMIQQIETYEWQEVRGEDGKFKQVPRKENDDASDMIRYALYTHTYVKSRKINYERVETDEDLGMIPKYRRRLPSTQGAIFKELLNR